MTNELENQPLLYKNTIEKLCHLPLFMGHSRSDLEQIISKNRFDFQKKQANQIICSENQSNNQLIFLIEGTVKVTRRSNSNSILFEEYIDAPAVIGADNIFGISHYFTHTFQAVKEVNLMILEKIEVTSNLLNYEVFRLNLINMISLLAQYRTKLVHSTLENDLRKRFIQYLVQQFMTPSGKKIIFSRQEDIAKELLTNERRICSLLKKLEGEGLVKVGRSNVIIHSFQALVQSK